MANISGENTIIRSSPIFHGKRQVPAILIEPVEYDAHFKGDRYTGNSFMVSLAPNVATLCTEAIDRIKAMYTYTPQYTLHDDQHFLRTTELMGLSQ